MSRVRYLGIPREQLIADFTEMLEWRHKLNQMTTRYRPQSAEYKALQKIHDAMREAGDFLIGPEDNPHGWIAPHKPEPDHVGKKG